MNLEEGQTEDIKIEITVPKELSNRIGRLETAKNGFLFIRVSLIDNDADKKTSTTIAYEGGIKRFVEKYGSPSSKVLKVMLDNAKESAIVKD